MKMVSFDKKNTLNFNTVVEYCIYLIVFIHNFMMRTKSQVLIVF